MNCIYNKESKQTCTMKGNFRGLLRKFCLESSIVGLKYFYLYPDKISRCFWAVTIIAVFNMACWLTWLLYNRFDQMPTRINIENQYEPLQSLPHPAVTICSPNQITISSMNHLNKTFVNGNLSIDLETVLPQLLGFYELVEGLNQDDLVHLQSLLELNRYTIMEVMGFLPQKCENFLKLCNLDGMWYPNCRELFHPILTPRGLCCIFNSQYYFTDKHRNEQHQNFEPHTIVSTGLMNGLTVLSDFDPDDAIDSTILNAGAIRIMFMDWTEFPSNDEFSLVTPHAESYHLIQATYTYCSDDVMGLAISSRKCYFEDESYLQFFGRYHNSDCDLLCYVQAVQNLCHCFLFYLPNVSLNRACNLTDIVCITHVKMDMSNWLHLDVCECPRDCVSRQYETDTLIGNLAGLPYLIDNPYGSIKFNESTSLMHFVFPQSVYVKQKQETVMSLISLSSNLGGVFGLCLGCSFTSFLEILFYTYAAIGNTVRSRLQKRRMRKVGVGYRN